MGYELDADTKLELTLERARISFWHFCKLMFPTFFTDDKKYLRQMCDDIQKFVENPSEHFLVINAPPRHGKSLIAQCLTAWLFGRNTDYRVMTGSYNETLSSLFARSVRNMILTKKAGDVLIYNDIFPDTQVKYGEAAAQMWSLEGSSRPNYLATSPTGTATGFGCDFLIIDDIIKNSEEAYNEMTLDKHWQWFTNTMLTRLEGNRKMIVIMTRWAEGDLAGRIINAYGDAVKLITYKAVNEDGTMLCPAILDRKAYDMLTQEMNLDIVEANYNQKPIDVQGRLYSKFKEWESLPQHSEVLNYTDTADTGADYLCSINYVVYEKEAYITNLVFTDAAMEITEGSVAALLHDGEVTRATIESNNGGRGFARNVERILSETYDSNRTIVNTQTQTHNKESRILASSAWVQNHIYMPAGWKQRFPEFYKQVMNYQKKGKNAHDDAVDVLAAIYEAITTERKAEVITASQLDDEDFRQPFEMY